MTDPELREQDADPNPFRQFATWYEDARAAKVAALDAITVATATSDGVPSARMVLLKGVDARGPVFYSNYESQKGRELAENPRAALVLYWPELHRQVRVNGRVEKVSRAESEIYFMSRPGGSRLSTAASHQSTVIPDRSALEARVRDLAAEFAGGEVPLPPYWGGYRVVPTTFEFWQGRPNRLHDRLRYTRRADDTWQIERLAP